MVSSSLFVYQRRLAGDNARAAGQIEIHRLKKRE
jgi:hypothetical protein